MRDAVFRINTPVVAWEAIDGEVIIINLESGHYYSLTAAGPALWEAIQSGMMSSACVATVGALYDGDRPTIVGALETLIDDLETEQLIVPTDDSPAANDPASSGAIIPSSDERAVERPPFVAPVLERYIDLQRLIQLDPIHDVDAQGSAGRRAVVVAVPTLLP